MLIKLSANQPSVDFPQYLSPDDFVAHYALSVFLQIKRDNEKTQIEVMEKMDEEIQTVFELNFPNQYTIYSDVSCHPNHQQWPLDELVETDVYICAGDYKEFDSDSDVLPLLCKMTREL